MPTVAVPAEPVVKGGASFRRPKLLDLCCCAGGASTGYQRAGFDVYGVDIDAQPRYPFAFHQGDVLQVLRQLAHGYALTFVHPSGEVEQLHLWDFAAVHVSPPCQGYSISRHMPTNEVAHPDLVDDVRRLLVALVELQPSLVWVIENVQGAPLRDPLKLCGSHFDLVAVDRDGALVQLRRHRLFESNVFLMSSGPCCHRPGVPFASVFGHGGNASLSRRDDPTRSTGYIPHINVCRDLLGAPWMNKRELSESIPPAYTEFVGRQLMTWIP